MQAAAASAEAGLSQPEQRYSSTLLRLMQITVECALDWSKSWGLSSVCVHGCVKGWGCTRVCAMGEQTAAVLQGAPRCLLLLLAEPRQYSWHFGAPSCCCRCFGGTHAAPLCPSTQPHAGPCRPLIGQRQHRRLRLAEAQRVGAAVGGRLGATRLSPQTAPHPQPGPPRSAPPLQPLCGCHGFIIGGDCNSTS